MARKVGCIMSKYPSIFEADNEDDEVRGQISGGVWCALMSVLHALPAALAAVAVLSVVSALIYKVLTAPVKKFTN